MLISTLTRDMLTTASDVTTVNIDVQDPSAVNSFDSIISWEVDGATSIDTL